MVKVHELWYDELPILFPCHKQLVAKSQGRWPKKSLASLFRSWVAVSWVKNTNKFLRLTLEIIHNQVPFGMQRYRFGFACVSVHVQFFNGFGRCLHVGLHCDDADPFYFSDWIFLWIGVSACMNVQQALMIWSDQVQWHHHTQTNCWLNQIGTGQGRAWERRHLVGSCCHQRSTHT